MHCAIHVKYQNCVSVPFKPVSHIYHHSCTQLHKVGSNDTHAERDKTTAELLYPYRFVIFHHNNKPEVSDETGALLVYSSFITYKSFSHRPT